MCVWNSVCNIKRSTLADGGSGRSVGIATRYGLDGPGIESWYGRDFPHLSRPVLGPAQAPCTMGTGSFPGVNCGRGLLLTPHPLLAPRSSKSRAVPLPPLGHKRACNGVSLPLLWPRVFENAMSRKIFRPKCNDVRLDWRWLRSGGFLSSAFYRILAAVQIKKNEMDRQCDTYGEKRDACKILLWKPEGKRLLGRRRRRWEETIKISFNP